MNFHLAKPYKKSMQDIDRINEINFKDMINSRIFISKQLAKEIDDD